MIQNSFDIFKYKNFSIKEKNLDLGKDLLFKRII